MFDPGVLLRHIFADRLAKYDVKKNNRFGKIRIVPHFKDELVFKRQRPDLLKHFISPDGEPLKILESMLGAELVIASSLHGIIFAESLGIPAIWITSPGGEAQFKYLDYYEGTSRFGVKPIETIGEALSATPPPLPVFAEAEFPLPCAIPVSPDSEFPLPPLPAFAPPPEPPL